MGNKNSQLDDLTAKGGESIETRIELDAGGGIITLPRGPWIFANLCVQGSSQDRVELSIGTHTFRAIYQNNMWTFTERIPAYMMFEDPIIHIGCHTNRPTEVIIRYQRYPAPPPVSRMRTMRGDSLIYIC